ncbi:MAG: hypothetical protein GC168_10490 [Candidatus Hydrogenedens sp.]|nr:hypothetical protein [Candidatus Hydrogenedens sp.]
MQFRILAVLLLLAGVLGAATPLSAQEIGRDAPWALRVHYSFPQPGMTLDYEEKTSRWRVRTDAREIADEVYFSIEFAEGAPWTYNDLEDAVTVRERYTDEVIGKAARYTTTYPPKDGIVVQYVVTVYNDRPITTAQLQITNSRETPVFVKALDPWITGPKGVTNLSPDASVRERRFEWRGGYPVFSRDGDPVMTVFREPSADAILALGFLPDGQATSGTDFEQREGAWFGRAYSHFEPPLRVMPGATLSSDRLAICHGVPQPAELDLYFAWVSTQISPVNDNRQGPKAWITVPEEEGLSDLVSGAQAWKPHGIGYALVPGNWESRPGSMSGAAPRYPRSMKSAADSIEQAGVTAGITIDPLSIDSGPGAATLQSTDGQQWLNPASPEAESFAQRRYADLADWGFDFVVVEPSQIPDDVLMQFGLTRARAEALALKLIAAAVGPKSSVYPASEGAVRAVRADWLEAASAIGRLADYNYGIGPVRLDLDGLGALQEETAQAMRLWRGPIELIGRPSNDGARSLERVLRAPRFAANPVDLYSPETLVWQLDQKDDKGVAQAASLLAFSGAPVWDSSDVYIGRGRDLRLWDTQRGQFVDGSGPVPAGEGLRLFGASDVVDRPWFIAASDDSFQSLPSVKSLQWDGASNVLRGTLGEGVTGDTAVRIHVPQGWKLDSAKAGGKNVRGSEENGEQLSVGLGGASSFELKFKRQ